MQSLLTDAFHAALRAVDARTRVPAHLPAPPAGRTLVVGGGKAAAAMAAAVETHWPSAAPLAGRVVTRYQHGLPTARIDVVEASHPLPDGRGAAAAQAMLDSIRELTPDDLLLVLLSGGGSSLLALPLPGVSLKALRAVTRGLLASGAPIAAINTVRRHLTQFSGGRVAALSRAPVVGLLLSDVVGDDIAAIASGPTAPDATTYHDALALLAAYRVAAPDEVVHALRRGAAGELADTAKPGDACFARTRNTLVGHARDALAAARVSLESVGVAVIELGEIDGDAVRVARDHAALIHTRLADTPRPFALVSGGETTVATPPGSGRGGRNTTYLLALGLALARLPGAEYWALACDSDGLDGSEDNAGALWTPACAARAASAGHEALARLDAYGFFSGCGTLVHTGPTRTNVNDVRIVLVA
jgi:hydroxypyruvate reductase